MAVTSLGRALGIAVGGGDAVSKDMVGLTVGFFFITFDFICVENGSDVSKAEEEVIWLVSIVGLSEGDGVKWPPVTFSVPMLDARVLAMSMRVVPDGSMKAKSKQLFIVELSLFCIFG